MALPPPPSFGLDGKRALIVGASSGIGLGCAVALAEAGAEVVLASRSEEKLVALVREFQDNQWRASHNLIDVTDVPAMVESIEASGPFDILVNSAGFSRHTPALETKVGDFDAVMNVNLRGAYFLAQAVARKLANTGRPGSIITISSQMGHVGGQERAVYCATKFAVEGFTKAMAIEWGPIGIRVNTIAPTFIRTPFTEHTLSRPEMREWIEDKIKLDRIGEPEDIMGAVVYLASDASALVTGTSLVVDGGWTAE